MLSGSRPAAAAAVGTFLRGAMPVWAVTRSRLPRAAAAAADSCGRFDSASAHAATTCACSAVCAACHTIVPAALSPPPGMPPTGRCSRALSWMPPWRRAAWSARKQRARQRPASLGARGAASDAAAAAARSQAQVWQAPPPACMLAGLCMRCWRACCACARCSSMQCRLGCRMSRPCPDSTRVRCALLLLRRRRQGRRGAVWSACRARPD